MNEPNNSSGIERKSDSEDTLSQERPMVSGAKFGLVVLCLYIAFILLIVIAGNSDSPAAESIRDVLDSIPYDYGRALLYSGPILIGIAGLITGIQKGRPGIGVLALLLTPIGFFFALAAEDRSTGKS